MLEGLDVLVLGGAHPSHLDQLSRVSGATFHFLCLSPLPCLNELVGTAGAAMLFALSEIVTEDVGVCSMYTQPGQTARGYSDMCAAEA